MSTPTPPGWYPVPGTGQERWWDGTGWTDSHRPAGRLNDAVTQSWDSSGLQQPAPAPAPPKAPGSGRGLVIGATAAVAVVVIGAVATAVWALQPSSGKKPDPVPTLTVGVSTPAPSPSRISPSPSRSPSPSKGDSVVLADKAHGWGVPMPDGWTAESATEKSSVIEIFGQYACSQSESLCVRGQFAVVNDPVDAADAQTAAEQEMAAFAPSIFGELKSHREEAAGTLTIAGSQGWAIRWYVEPKDGASGYVVVAAAPASDGSGYVILHGGVDDDPKAPDPSVLDDIVQGVTKSS
ncbi:DUF2510 domain-containing protein [Streptomyces sp. TLI_171]|uniref:DUF2510 domain-containing protein n=1 Tax=Streptomyces sp. TLI_171 TaxID=1938859 RepID=UPI000C174364|nr:DUF2510 domain-containing protein [Streptomyces sp. TLI_171]RKE18743.1 uncharacterized protein DUF2510 [Streptomyces sp. TLI_171]